MGRETAVALIITLAPTLLPHPNRRPRSLALPGHNMIDIELSQLEAAVSLHVRYTLAHASYKS